MADSVRIEELRKRYHENPRRFFAPLANEYRKSGFLDRAVLLCEKHLAEQPDNLNGLVVYGQTLFESGRPDDARAAFERALTLDPENLIALRQLGDIARIQGDVPTARRWYEKIVDFDRRNDEVLALLDEMGAGESVGVRESTEPAPVPLVRLAPARRASLLDVALDFGENVEIPVEPLTAPGDAAFPLLVDQGVQDAPAPALAAPEPRPAHKTPTFVTETMATLYVAQGFRDKAIEVYRQLIAEAPENTRLRAKLTELEAAVTEMPDFEALALESWEPDAEPADAMLAEVSFAEVGLSTPSLSSAEDPLRPPIAGAGQTARAFLSALAHRPLVTALAPVARASQRLNFDQFFPATPPDTPGDDDLNRFHGWLETLKP